MPIGDALLDPGVVVDLAPSVLDDYVPLRHADRVGYGREVAAAHGSRLPSVGCPLRMANLQIPAVYAVAIDMAGRLRITAMPSIRLSRGAHWSLGPGDRCRKGVSRPVPNVHQGRAGSIRYCMNDRVSRRPCPKACVGPETGATHKLSESRICPGGTDVVSSENYEKTAWR